MGHTRHTDTSEYKHTEKKNNPQYIHKCILLTFHFIRIFSHLQITCKRQREGNQTGNTHTRFREGIVRTPHELKDAVFLLCFLCFIAFFGFFYCSSLYTHVSNSLHSILQLTIHPSPFPVYPTQTRLALLFFHLYRNRRSRSFL